MSKNIEEKRPTQPKRPQKRFEIVLRTYIKTFLCLFRKPGTYQDVFKPGIRFGTGPRTLIRRRIRRFSQKAAIWSLIVMLCIGTVTAVSLAWRIKTVKCYGTARYTGEEIYSACGLNIGAPMLDFDDADVEERLRDAFPLLIQVNVKRRLSGEVILQAVEETELYYTQHYKNYYLLSGKTGEVLYVDAYADTWKSVNAVYVGLPEEARLKKGEKLTYQYLPYPGENAEQEISTYEVREEDVTVEFAYVDEVLDAVMASSFGTRVTGLELSEKFDIWFLLDGRITVILGSDSDIELKLSMAQKTLENIQSEGKAILDVSSPDKVSYREDPSLELPFWAN